MGVAPARRQVREHNGDAPGFVFPVDAHVVDVGADPHDPCGVRPREDVAELEEALHGFRRRERHIGPRGRRRRGEDDARCREQDRQQPWAVQRGGEAGCRLVLLLLQELPHHPLWLERIDEDGSAGLHVDAALLIGGEPRDSRVRGGGGEDAVAPADEGLFGQRLFGRGWRRRRLFRRRLFRRRLFRRRLFRRRLLWRTMAHAALRAGERPRSRRAAPPAAAAAAATARPSGTTQRHAASSGGSGSGAGGSSHCGRAGGGRMSARAGGATKRRPKTLRRRATTNVRSERERRTRASLPSRRDRAASNVKRRERGPRDVQSGAAGCERRGRDAPPGRKRAATARTCPGAPPGVGSSSRWGAAREGERAAADPPS